MHAKNTSFSKYMQIHGEDMYMCPATALTGCFRYSVFVLEVIVANVP